MTDLENVISDENGVQIVEILDKQLGVPRYFGKKDGRLITKGFPTVSGAKTELEMNVFRDQYLAPRNTKLGVSEEGSNQSAERTMASPSLASAGRRLQAQFIDGIATYAFGYLSFYLLSSLVATQLAGYCGIAAGVAYLLLADALPNGQSLGKRILGMQVLSQSTLQPCTLQQSFLRNVTFPLGIIDWFPIFFSSRRRFGDFIASTIVVTS